MSGSPPGGSDDVEGLLRLLRGLRELGLEPGRVAVGACSVELRPRASRGDGDVRDPDVAVRPRNFFERAAIIDRHGGGS